MAYYGRFQSEDRTFYGEVLRDKILELHANPLLEAPSVVREHPLASLQILVPVVPSKVIAVGLNYADHAKETGKPIPEEPLIWIKANSSLLPHESVIQIAYPEHRTDFEAELCIVMGRHTKGVNENGAVASIFGYTCSQDITDRTIQARESQWTRSKSFDTYTPIGPFIRTDLDPSNLRIQQFQNGMVRQDSRTTQCIFKPAQLVSFISQHITLLPGDVILTGTPPGIHPIQKGDQLEVRIEGLASLQNSVA